MSYLTENDIYKIVKTCIPDGYKPRFNIEKTSTRNPDGTVNQVPNTITIKILPAESPLRSCDGIYYNYKKRVQFNIFTDKGGEDQIETGYKICNTIKQGMDSLIGKQGIIDTRLVIDSKYIGLTDQFLHSFSLEYKLTY